MCIDEVSTSFTDSEVWIFLLEILTRLLISKLISDMSRGFERFSNIPIRVNQSLRWDTSIVRTVPTYESLLDHENIFSCTRESECYSEPT